MKFAFFAEIILIIIMTTIFPAILTAEDFSVHFRDNFWFDFVKEICRRHNISGNLPKRAEHGESVVFLLGEKYVVKIYIPNKNGMRREKTALEFARTRFKLPEIIHFGQIENYFCVHQIVFFSAHSSAICRARSTSTHRCATQPRWWRWSAMVIHRYRAPAVYGTVKNHPVPRAATSPDCVFC